MKNTLLITMLLCSVALFSACKDKETRAEVQQATSEKPSTTAPVNTTDGFNGASGTVTETMNAAGYTYVQVDTGSEKFWAAAPLFSVNTGDNVIVPSGMAMTNYHSKSLDRDFPVVYFVEAVLNASNVADDSADSQSPQLPPGHPPLTGQTAPQIDLSNITRADSGQTIAEIYSQKEQLAGNSVTVRGKVVKFSPQIMDTNWLHIQDGSGSREDGSNDLTVTSNAQVKVGDTVVIKGNLTADKDFGFGYKYALIVEGAEVTLEQ